MGTVKKWEDGCWQEKDEKSKTKDQNEQGVCAQDQTGQICFDLLPG